MALTCILGNFKKKINSTKRMPTNSGTLHNIICKDPISLQNPVLICTGTPLEHYNYMYFNNWWYYVDDVVSYTNNTFKVIAHVDPLATGKMDIMGTKAFCKYADYEHWNPLLDDPRVSTDLEDTTANKIIRMNSTGTVEWSQSGMVILRSLAQTTIANTSVVTYVMTMQQFSYLLSGLSSVLISDFNGISDFGEVVKNIAVKLLGAGNWSDNILSCVWVPFDASNYTDLATTDIVRIGAYEVPMTSLCKFSYDTIMIKSKNDSYTIPWTTNQNNYKFLRYPKYTSLTLCHPCGVVEINSPSLANQGENDTIKIVYAVDLFSGDYYIIAKTGNVSQAGTPDLLSEVLGIGQGNVSMSVMNKVGEGFNLGSAVLRAEASVTSGVYNLLTPKKVIPATKVTTTTKIMKGSKGQNVGEINKTETETTMPQQTSSGIEGDFDISFPKQASVNATCGGGVLPLYHALTSFNDQFYIQMNASIPACILNYQYNVGLCDNYGYPCNQVLQLTNIDGYVECVGASCSSQLPQNLVETINSYLNTGIIIE